MTKLYLHDASSAESGTLPGATTQSATSPSVTAAGASTNRLMDQIIGVGPQAAPSLSTLAQTAEQKNWFRRWSSGRLAAQTVRGPTNNNWSLNISGSASSSNSVFKPWLMTAYIWSPSSGTLVGRIFDGLTAGQTVAITAGFAARSATISSGGSDIACSEGDLLILEVWGENIQTSAMSFTNQIGYDGATEDFATNCASYLSCVDTLSFAGPPVAPNPPRARIFIPSGTLSVPELNIQNTTPGPATYNPAIDSLYDQVILGDLPAYGAYWKLNEQTGTILSDRGPLDFDLTISGSGNKVNQYPGPIPSDPANTSLLMDGAALTGSVQANASRTEFGFPGRSVFSLEVWYYPLDFLRRDSGSGISGVLFQHRQTSNGAGGYWITIDENAIANTGTAGLTFQKFDSADTTDTGSSTIQLERYQWNHCVITYDGTNVSFYINSSDAGSFVSTKLIPETYNGIFYLGSGGFWPNPFGYLARAAVYGGTALTREQVIEHYLAGSATTWSPLTDPRVPSNLQPFGFLRGSMLRPQQFFDLTIPTFPVTQTLSIFFEGLQGIQATEVDPFEATKSLAITGSEPLEATQAIQKSDSTDAWEANQGIQKVGSVDPYDANQGIASTKSEPLDATKSLSITGSESYEATQAVQKVGSTDPVEATQGIQKVGSPEPYEGLQGIQSTKAEPWEANKSLSITGGDPYDANKGLSTTNSEPWEANQAIQKSSSLVWEALKALSITAGEVLEALKSLQITGNADAWEALRGIQSTNPEPYEATQKLAITGSEPYESQQPITKSASDPLEANQGITKNLSDPYEANQGIASTNSEPWEAEKTISQSGSEPWEANKAIQAVGNADTYEATQGIRSTSADPYESVQKLTISGVLPWEALVALSKTVVVPYEALQGIAASGTFPWEANSPANQVTQTASFPYDATQSLAISGPINYETLLNVLASSSYPWTSLQGVSGTKNDPWEANRGITASGSTQYEASQPISASRSESWEALVGITKSVSYPFEALKSIQAASGDPLETLQKIASTSSLPFEALMLIASSSSLPWDATGIVFTSVSNTANLQLDVTSGLAISGVISIDAQKNLTITRSQPYEGLVRVPARTTSLPYESLIGITNLTELPLEVAIGIVSRLLAPWEAGGKVPIVTETGLSLIGSYFAPHHVMVIQSNPSHFVLYPAPSELMEGKTETGLDIGET